MINWITYEDKITLNILKIIVYEFGIIKKLKENKQDDLKVSIYSI